MNNTEKTTLSAEELGTVTGGEKLVRLTPVTKTRTGMPSPAELERLRRLKKLFPNGSGPRINNPVISPVIRVRTRVLLTPEEE